MTEQQPTQQVIPPTPVDKYTFNIYLYIPEHESSPYALSIAQPPDGATLEEIGKQIVQLRDTLFGSNQLANAQLAIDDGYILMSGELLRKCYITVDLRPYNQRLEYGHAL